MPAEVWSGVPGGDRVALSTDGSRNLYLYCDLAGCDWTSFVPPHSTVRVIELIAAKHRHRKKAA